MNTHELIMEVMKYQSWFYLFYNSLAKLKTKWIYESSLMKKSMFIVLDFFPPQQCYSHYASNTFLTLCALLILSTLCFFTLQCIFFFFFHLFIFYFFLLYNIVLVLPYINMNLPWVYTCSPSWTPFPPPSPYHAHTQLITLLPRLKLEHQIVCPKFTQLLKFRQRSV